MPGPKPEVDPQPPKPTQPPVVR